MTKKDFKRSLGEWFYLHSPGCLSPHGVMRRTRGGYTAVAHAAYANEASKEDVKLAAAAPDLLAALQAILETTHCQNKCKRGDMSCATRRAEEAIRKAKRG